jgi:hypothetical protein
VKIGSNAQCQRRCNEHGEVQQIDQIQPEEKVELMNHVIMHFARRRTDGRMRTDSHDQDGDYRAENTQAPMQAHAVCGDQVGLGAE